MKSTRMPETDEEFFTWVRSLPGFATALRQLREMQGLTIEEVAELTDLSKSYVDRLERGERKPDRDTAIVLLLAGFSLPVPRANPLLTLAGYAPIYPRRYYKLFLTMIVKRRR